MTSKIKYPLMLAAILIVAFISFSMYQSGLDKSLNKKVKFLLNEKPLKNSVFEKNLIEIKSLIDSGAAGNGLADNGFSTLCLAAELRSPLAKQMIELLLHAGANPNLGEGNCSPKLLLSSTLSNADENTALMLFDFGLQLEKPTLNRVLRAAVIHQNIEIAKFLVPQVEDINKIKGQGFGVDTIYQQALMAANEKADDLIALMLDHGLKIETRQLLIDCVDNGYIETLIIVLKGNPTITSGLKNRLLSTAKYNVKRKGEARKRIFELLDSKFR